MAAPESANEGDGVSVTANVGDPDGDAVKVEWDFNADGVVDFTDNDVAASSSVSHSWTYADNGTATVLVTVTDPSGATATASADITSNNVSPSISSFSATTDPVHVGNAANANATFTDPGTSDTHTASINWGDGTTSAGSVSETNGSGSISASHSYAAAGLYTVSITLVDKDGGSAVASTQYVIVYDPFAGQVKGSAYIDAKANNDLQVSYPGDVTVPTGYTAWSLADKRRFQSTSHEWLVVVGNNAWYMASGMLDGVNGYHILVAAMDNGPGAKAGDKLRVKIWNADGVVYDSQPGAPIAASPSRMTGGGTLTIK
jgi:PKD repeat protein